MSGFDSRSGSVREVASNEHEHRLQAVHHDQKGDDSYDSDGHGALEHPQFRAVRLKTRCSMPESYGRVH